MNKSPDTRNKLDNNQKLKKRVKKPITIIELRKAVIDSATARKREPIKETKGETFKKLHGYSKSMKRNLDKHNDISAIKYSDALNRYREIRKERKKAEKLASQKKHQASVAYKRTNKKTKGKTQSKTKKKDGE